MVQQVSTATAALVATRDRFGLDLLDAVGDRSGNVVVSPVSLGVALQMVGAGARGATAAQLANVLHLPGGAGSAAAAAAGQARLATTSHDTLQISTTVWAQRGMPVEPAFLTTLRHRFDADVHRADFRQDPGGARKHINATVARQTAGEINALFPRGALSSRTRLVLADVIHLAAPWALEFPEAKTATHPFTRPDGSTVPVPMMHNDIDDAPPGQGKLGYAAGPGYQIVTLPYAGGELAFTLLLPTRGTVAAMIDKVRARGLPAVLGAVEPEPVRLAMPTFTVRTERDVSGTLAALGMPLAFSRHADFSGITTAVPLRIQTVRHDVVVRVDEHGTRAAAASGVGVSATAAVAGVRVTADHPFLFVITATATGAPLFLGRITDPAAR